MDEAGLNFPLQIWLKDRKESFTGDVFVFCTHRDAHACLLLKRLEARAAIVKMASQAELPCGFSNGVSCGVPFGVILVEEMLPDEPAAQPVERTWDQKAIDLIEEREVSVIQSSSFPKVSSLPANVFHIRRPLSSR